MGKNFIDKEGVKPDYFFLKIADFKFPRKTSLILLGNFRTAVIGDFITVAYRRFG
jgi:hypothetical protein